MSTNSDLQQINTFSKGMNTDTSDAFLSNELYRYAENLRFITEDGTSNGGELRSIEGWLELYDTHIDVFAMQSIRQYIVIVGLADEGWNIWSIDTTAINWELKKHFGPCIGDENRIGSNISIVARWESDSNIKVYIADGTHQLMSLNIARDSKGNVRDYGTDVKNISGRLEITLNLIWTTINRNRSNSITAPVLQYSYILYNIGGQLSSMSPLSKPVVLYDNDKGYALGQSINCTVTVNIDNIDIGAANRIRLYRIGYTQNGYSPDIALIYDEDLKSSSFSFEDKGFNIATLSEAEFKALNGIEFKPLLIESKNDYLFAANIKYDQLEIDDKFLKCDVLYEFLTCLQQYEIDLYNNIKNGEYVPSFKRGEKYRFGTVFYDKRGRRSSVMSIKDIDVYDLSVFTISDGGKSVKVNTICVKANISNIPEDCSGYEIVRCKRSINDSRCITQGIVGRTYKLRNKDNSSYGFPFPLSSSDKYGDSPYRFAFPYLTFGKYGIQRDFRDAGDNTTDCIYAKDVAMFASPEYSYLADDIKSIFLNYGGNYNRLSLNILTNHSIPYTSTEEGDLMSAYTSEFAPTNRRMVLLGDGESHGSYKEYGEFFTKYTTDGDLNNVYMAMPGVYCSSDPSKYQSVIEKDSEGRTTEYIGVCKLYCTSDDDGFQCLFKISDVDYTESPSANSASFNNDYNVLINNDSVSVGEKQFVNWDAPTFYWRFGYFRLANYEPAQSDLWNVPDNDTWKDYGITAGGKYILLGITTNESNEDYNPGTEPLPISIAEIVTNNENPYGGDSDTSKNNSVFYSFGDYKARQEGVDTDEIISTNGDCYIGMFTFNSGHAYESGRYVSRKYPTVYIVPVESAINLKAVYGDLYTNMTSDYKYWFQDKAGAIGKLTQEKDAYLYNTVYNGSYDLMSYTPISYTSISNDKFDCRVHYSQIKTNGESVDSWLNFKAADFIDVDTRYGEITDLNLFKDTLVFWLDKAAGVLAVNERTMLQDVNDTNIILGNGDVLLRYDYLTTEYGMKPALKARTLSNNALYWWDGYNKEILQYPGGHEVLPLKKIKTVSKYVNNILEKIRPCLAYDNKYAEVLMSLLHIGVKNDTWDYLTLVYNEYVQQFTGVYKIAFDFSIKLVDKLILENNNILYRWNCGDSNSLYVSFAPRLEYIINKVSTVTKVYDNVEFGMGDSFYLSTGEDHKKENLTDLTFEFHTPLELYSSLNENITNREYDLRFAIPRAGGKPYGDRLRGRTMLCTLTAADNNSNFSLLYIITKYRISYS